MKKITSLFFILFSILVFSQNYELSTLRIGEFKIYLSKTEAEAIANKKLQQFEDYEKKNIVNYYGDKIEILIDEIYNPASENIIAVSSISTKSSKFKTKSGMGVGNTKAELINTYMDFDNYRMSKSWENDNESFFSLIDYDASTELSFRLVNKVVVEVTVSVIYEG